jgi:hypothetical protein
MFRFRRVFLSLPFLCLAALAAQAATDPMVGAWKLNPQKSRLVDEMKIASLGGNKYSFDFGGPTPETIVVDGTDQPGMAGTTLAVTSGPDNWLVVRKKGGRVLLKGIWTLSKDGNQLHDDYTEFADNGKTTHVDYLYDRRAPGSGFAGDWVSTNGQVDAVYLMELRPYGDDGLSILVPSEGVTRNLKFDGKDYPNPGSTLNSLTSARRVNESTIELTDKSNNAILDIQQISVSPDGKTLTITMHVPARTDANVLVFDRQ